MLSTKIIGQRIAEARRNGNSSQAQLAERLFISAQAVGKWERGESLPDILMLNRLAEILDVDLNYFSASFQAADAGEKPVAGQPVEVTAPAKVQPGKQPLNWNMSHGNWVDADFSGLKNLQETFSSSNMKNCLFVGSDLSGLLLESNHVESCDFSGSDISSSAVRSSSLVNNAFKDCSLQATTFSENAIKGCDFSGADLTGAAFKSGSLQKSTMSGAVWNRTSFHAMHLADLVFDGAWNDCSFDNCAFSKVTFQNAALTNTFFKGRSLKRIRFIDCTADTLTYAFLKNGKADLTGVTVLP